MIISKLVNNVRRLKLADAMLDLVVVFIGVFIGIQASNWNDSRLDQSRAHLYLERLGLDIDADIESYRDRIRFWGHVTENGMAGLKYAETRVLKDSDYWELLLAYFQASQVAALFTSQATYDELKSSGELSLISSIELRNSLASYYTTSYSQILIPNPAYRESIRGLIPIETQNYIWDKCWATNATGIQELISCEPFGDRKKYQTLVEAIASNEVLMSELRFWVSVMRVSDAISQSRIDFASQIRSLIDAELNKQ